MIFSLFLLSILTASQVRAVDPLKAALESPTKLLSLFSEFRITEHRSYSGNELSFRYRVFRQNLAEIVRLNEDQDSYRVGVNFLTDLTPEEQSLYQGLNATDDGFGVVAAGTVDPVLPVDTTEVNWSKRNAVAPVKDQGRCGSCWSFSGTGALESRYAIATGALKPMSDQEGLDCSYEDRSYNRDGCRGGWPRDVWTYVTKHRNHYSEEKDYPYEAKDLKCRTRGKPTALSTAKLTSYVNLEKGDDHLIHALLSGAVAVAFKVQSGFNYYKTGIYKDPSCPQRSPSHAVLATGYAPNYIWVKNSWGVGWGDKGFIKFARIGNMCGISGYAAVPVLTGATPDQDPKCRDEHRECAKWAQYCGTGDSWLFMATRCPVTCGLCSCDMTGCNLCKDRSECATWATNGYCTKPNYKDFMANYCSNACGVVCPRAKKQDNDDDDDDNDERCPDGLKWCKGKCMHEHFC